MKKSYNLFVRMEQSKFLDGLAGGEINFGGQIKLNEERAKNK